MPGLWVKNYAVLETMKILFLVICIEGEKIFLYICNYFLLVLFSMKHVFNNLNFINQALEAETITFSFSSYRHRSILIHITYKRCQKCDRLNFLLKIPSQRTLFLYSQFQNAYLTQ